MNSDAYIALRHTKVTQMIVQRFEKGPKFLDLLKTKARLSDDVEWHVEIYEDQVDMNKHSVIRFDSEVMARMFINLNQWTEQKPL